VSEIKRVENYPAFEKLVHIIQHGLRGLKLKISKGSQQRQMILVIFCRSGSVAYIYSKCLSLIILCHASTSE